MQNSTRKKHNRKKKDPLRCWTEVDEKIKYDIEDKKNDATPRIESHLKISCEILKDWGDENV